jgi:hypothetical protein
MGVTMRRLWMGFAGLGALGGLALASACAQTHKVSKPEQVVRAVAVYEWTGDEAKPTGSRVVPVSLFINGQLQDAGVYLAQPVPFALDTGVVYELRKAGVEEGTLELVYERHLTTGDTAEIDDGWLGYGKVKPKPAETLLAKKQSGPLPKLVVTSNGSSDQPHFSGRRGDDGSSSGAGTSAKTASPAPAVDDADSDEPVMHRRQPKTDDSTTASSGTATQSGTAASTGGSSASTPSARESASTADPNDEADRPTLKRRTPAERKADQKKRDSARVIAGNDLNDDPDRPILHRGAPGVENEEDAIPPLRGIPKDMQQMVAVSDARTRPEHDFARPWESDDERTQVLAKMQAFARAKLADYKGVGPLVSSPAPVATAAKTASANRTKKRAATPPPAPPAPLPLTDEVLKGYTLSYGGAATYYYGATSAGVGGVSRYVSVVAQEEPITGLKVALASVTDSAHLDRTAWMRLVDVVDADASNRASMLMELRAQHTRQFALYRVIGAEADQVFVTGSTE